MSEKYTELLLSSEQTLKYFERKNWLLRDHMPGLYYAGKFHIDSAMQFQAESFRCHLILYIFSGNGTLLYPGGSLFLSENELLFLDCCEQIQLRLVPPGMNCALFFLRSDEAAPYYQALNSKKPPHLTLPPSSDIEYYVNQLLDLIPVHSTECAIAASKWIISILAEFCSLLLSENQAAEYIPDYIHEMKETFDLAYQAPFHLEDFESRFSIHKERLCREFSRYYGMPPLQYLNARRIEAAKDLLLSTNMRVYEVGNAVGIENTNHFINLFKKSTGVTPMQFKKNAPAAVCGLHCPHKPDAHPQ